MICPTNPILQKRSRQLLEYQKEKKQLNWVENMPDTHCCYQITKRWVDNMPYMHCCYQIIKRWVDNMPDTHCCYQITKCWVDNKPDTHCCYQRNTFLTNMALSIHPAFTYFSCDSYVIYCTLIMCSSCDCHLL